MKNHPHPPHTQIPWREKWENSDLYSEMECDPSIGDGGTHTVLDEEKVKSFISEVEREARDLGAIESAIYIYRYVESQAGVSGRREILDFIKLFQKELSTLHTTKEGK